MDAPRKITSMKIIRIFTYILILVGTTTVCLSAFHDETFQQFACLTKTPSSKPLQQLELYQYACPVMASGIH
jgi:hypothetical protein